MLILLDILIGMHFANESHEITIYLVFKLTILSLRGVTHHDV